MINYGKTVLAASIQGISISIIILFISITEIRGQNPITFSGPAGQSSEKETPPIKERIFYGGSFSLQLGSLTNIEVSPIVGLWILPRVAVAVGPSYRYYKYSSNQTRIYGARAYLQFVVFRDINKVVPIGVHTSLFLHLEDELLSLDSEYWRNVSIKPNRFGVNTVLAGVGLSQQIGKKAALNFIVMWALNQSQDQVYNNPEIRISFVF
jgi:hypothetical protein